MFPCGPLVCRIVCVLRHHRLALSWEHTSSRGPQVLGSISPRQDMSALLASLSTPAPGGLCHALARRRALADRAAEIQAEARRTRDQLRRRGEKRKRQPHREAVAEGICRMIGGDEGAAAADEYFQARGPAPAAASPTGGRGPRSRGAAVPAAEPAESRRPRPRPGPDEALSAGAQKAAEKFCKERTLARWVGRMNADTGLTPTAAYVWSRWTDAEPLGIPDASGAAGPAAPLGKPALQWLRRWRRRWGLRLAAAHPGPRLPTETLRAKAGGKGVHVVGQTGPPRATNIRTRGSVLRGHFGARILTPVSGPAT